MTDYERGFLACRERAAKVCEEMSHLPGGPNWTWLHYCTAAIRAIPIPSGADQRGEAATEETPLTGLFPAENVGVPQSSPHKQASRAEQVAPKDGSHSVTGLPPAPAREPQWKCVICGFNNEHKWQACNGCRAPRSIY